MIAAVNTEQKHIRSHSTYIHHLRLLEACQQRLHHNEVGMTSIWITCVQACPSMLAHKAAASLSSCRAPGSVPIRHATAFASQPQRVPGYPAFCPAPISHCRQQRVLVRSSSAADGAEVPAVVPIPVIVEPVEPAQPAQPAAAAAPKGDNFFRSLFRFVQPAGCLIAHVTAWLQYMWAELSECKL